MDNVFDRDLKGNPLCGTCQRFSQFVPVRLAIAIDDPNGVISFGAPDDVVESLPQLPSGLSYILRRLNEGYVYAYSESWKFNHFNDTDFHVYQVNETGYITAVDKDEINDFKPSTYKCFQSGESEGNLENAFGLDFFVNLEEDSKVNIVYTRHQLSPKTLQYLKENKKNREIFMPSIDIKNGSKNLLDIDGWDVLENKESLAQSANLVPWEKDFLKLFSRSKYKTPRYADGETVYLVAYERDSNGKVKFDKDDNPIPIPGSTEPYEIIKGDRLIILNDQIGMVEDLLNIIEYKKELSISEIDKKKFQAMTNILTLKANVQGKIFADEFSKLRSKYDRKVIDEEKEKFSALEQSSYEINRQISIQYENRKYNYTLKEIEEINKKTKDEFEDTWSKTGFFRSKPFASFYKEEEMFKWIDSSNNDKQDFIDNNLLPIIKVYLLFLQSNNLLNYMEYAFDHETKFSSATFLEICSRIIGESDTFKIATDYYYKLLNESDFSNRKNYLFRLMTFDSKNIQSKILAAAGTLNTYQMTGVAFAISQLVDESGLKILSSTNIQLNDLSVKLDRLNALLSEQIGGCVSRVINGQAQKSFNKTVAIKSLETFSNKILSGKPYSGTLTQVIDSIVKDFNIDYSDLQTKKNQSKRNAKKSLKSEYLSNVRNMLEGIFFSNPEFYEYGKKQVRISVVIFGDQPGKIFTGDDVIRNTQGEIIRTQGEISQVENTKKQAYARTGTGFGFGIFAFNLQFVSLLGAIEKTSGSIQTQFELAAALSATVGNIADVFSRNLTAKIAYYGKTMNSQRLLNNLERIMKGGLYGGALILSGIEIHKGANSLIKRNITLSFSYFVNAGMIFWSTSLFVRGGAYLRLGLTGGWWGLITLPILYGISEWIEYQKNNVMKEYIAQSIWGIEARDWSLAQDEQAFKRTLEN
jgi:hypothetical protein